MNYKIAACLSLILIPVIADANWQTIPLPDGDMQLEGVENWRPYRDSRLEKVPGAWNGRQALRVTVQNEDYGGLYVQATPRGGLGHRVRVTMTYRVTKGSSVTVYAGPNTWNQNAATLTSKAWETATIEVGLISDYHLVLHIVQRTRGSSFEIAELKIEAMKGERSRVDVSVNSTSPGIPHLGFRLAGTPLPKVSVKEKEGESFRVIRFGNGEGDISQSLGQLPAGTKLKLACRYLAVDEGEIVAGIRTGGKTLASEVLNKQEWADLELSFVLADDSKPEVYFGNTKSQAELSITDYHAWVELPDPTAPGKAELNTKRRSITFQASEKDAKSIMILPPWSEVRQIQCHLEYNSRWSFRSPDSHKVKLSEEKSELSLTWEFKKDPVEYSVHMKAEKRDTVLVEARIVNRGKQNVEPFVPGFCLKIGGAHAPKTFAYTIIPNKGKPFPLDGGHPFAARPGFWPGIGWVSAHYVDAPAYQERIKQGANYNPERNTLIKETGDFPLLARRLPGRDAWIAWLWPSAATGYFANTMTPCMHMDPVVKACPADQTRSVFGRMIFFEGTWEELYERAKRERKELAEMSGE